MADSWHKVTKFYRGGSHEFQIRIPAGVRLSKSDWEEILEWIGEHTSGGRNYGYSLRTRKLKAKSAQLPVVKYPSGLCAKLIEHGQDVTTTRRMI